MAKIMLRNVKKQMNKTIEEVYAEYIDNCIAIGKSPNTIQSKKRFYKY